MSDPCEICGGREKISLPVWQRTSISAVSTEPVAPTNPSREYPCPECGEYAPVERLWVQSDVGNYVSEAKSDPGFMEHVRRRLVHSLMDGIHRSDAVAFQEGPPSQWEMTTPLRATVGVISTRRVASLEQRIRARQTEIAHRAAELAIAGINYWGSLYEHTAIPKDVAASEIREAVRVAIKEFAEASPPDVDNSK